MLTRCPSCLGSKKITKLGLMLGDCDKCQGIGQIKKEMPKQSPKEIKETITEETLDAKKKK